MSKKKRATVEHPVRVWSVTVASRVEGKDYPDTTYTVLAATGADAMKKAKVQCGHGDPSVTDVDVVGLNLLAVVDLP